MQYLATSTRPKVQARKAAHIPQFQPYIAAFVAAHGGSQTVAKKLGLGTDSVNSWCQGAALPRLESLLKMADVFEMSIEDTDKMLILAGKPPIHCVRLHVANKPEASLPAILHAWRDQECGGDTQRAADTMGIARSYFSRLANGSSNLAGLEVVRRVARTLDMTIDETLEAAGLRNSPLAKKFKKMSEGVPGYLRSLMERVGLDPFEIAARSVFAKNAGIAESHFTSLLAGSLQASVADAQRLAALVDQPLTEVLVGLGYSPQTACQLSAGVKAAPRNVKTPLATLLRDYRLKAGVSQASVALALGTRWPSTVTFYEVGRHTPSVQSLVTIAKVTKAPLGRLLRAAGYLVA